MPKAQVKYRRIRLCVLVLISFLCVLALFGVTGRDTDAITSSLYAFSTATFDSKSWGIGQDASPARPDSLSHVQLTTREDKHAYVPGEEWAGVISATRKDESVPEPSPDWEPPHQVSAEQHGPRKASDPVKQKDSDGLKNKFIDRVDRKHGTDQVSPLVHGITVNSPQGDGKSDTVQENKKDADERVDRALETLADCSTIECIRNVHDSLKKKTKFNAPHFFLIGFQKCATTSVNHYLRGHPEYLPSVLKEAHYFTACKKSWEDTNCKANSTEDYIVNFLRIRDAAKAGLNAATVDASVDYAWKGEELAREIRKAFPWLKIVLMMREPISRVISYTRMWTEKGVRISSHDNRIACDDGEDLYKCIYPHLTPSAYTGHYAVPLEGWLKVWPSKQMHVIQFEEFTRDPEGVMRRLKMFLGMEPEYPKAGGMYNVNTRKTSGGSPMKKREYKTLVKMALPDSERVADLLHTHGLADKGTWMGNWQQVWDDVLDSCNASRICMVNSN